MNRARALLLLLALPMAAQTDTRLVKIQREQEANLAAAAPNWQTMCNLMDAIAIPSRRPGFLKENPRLSDRFANVDQFTDAVDRWKGRVWSLPRDIRRVDWDRVSVQCMESRSGDSVVVTLKERNNDRLLRIKGVFANSELVDISILAGSIVGRR